MDEENQKSYYAVIPASVRYDKTLNANAKLLYGEITALCNEKGYCWASNDYFAKLYNVSKITISRWIKALSDRNYVEIKMAYQKETKKINRRYIRVVHTINNNDNGFIENSTKIPQKFHKNSTIPQKDVNKNVKDNIILNKNDKGMLTKMITPILNKNVKDNNTINNTINTLPIPNISTITMGKNFKGRVGGEKEPTLEEFKIYTNSLLAKKQLFLDADDFWNEMKLNDWAIKTKDGEWQDVKNWKKLLLTRNERAKTDYIEQKKEAEIYKKKNQERLKQQMLDRKRGYCV